MSQEAYILFYVKQGTPWFSDFVQTQKLIIHGPISSTSPKSVLDNEDAISNPPSIKNSVAEVASPKRFIGLTHDRVKESVGNDTTAFHVATKSSDVCPPEAMKMPSPSLQDSNRKKIGIPKQHADLTLTTPPRSPSPEIYRQDSPGKITFMNLMC